MSACTLMVCSSQTRTLKSQSRSAAMLSCGDRCLRLFNGYEIHKAKVMNHGSWTRRRNSARLGKPQRNHKQQPRT